MSRFLGAFRQFFALATDAPLEFGEAAGLMTLSTIALGRRWLNTGDGIRPNIFLMLAGDSSVARKSTCVKFSQKMINEVDDQRIGPRDYTTEGLVRWMLEKDPATHKTRTKLTLFAEEFGADLARADAYSTTMFSDFCALYDGGTFEKARAKSTIKIDKPRVGMFAGAAYHMLQQYLKPRDWMSGFLMRFIFVTPQAMRPRFSLPPPMPVREWKQAALQLKVLRDDLQRNHIGIDLTQAAASLYSNVLDQFQAATINGAPIIQMYKARFETHLLKLALLYQVDEDPNAPIGHAAMMQAINFGFATAWPSFQAAHRKTAMNDFDGLFTAVLETLQTPMSRSQLAMAFFGNERLTGVVKYLEGHNMIRIVRNGHSEFLQAAVSAPQQ